jgi:hypothetical protein
MSFWVFLIGIIIGIIIGVAVSYRTAVTPLHQRIGKLIDQPELMKYYPYNPENFRYIGDPVDGIQFEEDTILFVRFKTDRMPRTAEQNRIKTLLKNGNVGWYEYITK